MASTGMGRGAEERRWDVVKGENGLLNGVDRVAGHHGSITCYLTEPVQQSSCM